MDYLIVKYVHLLGVLGVTSTLVSELILIKKEMRVSEIGKMAKIDSFYGLFAILALSAGFVLWFGVGKPEEFYSNQIWIFLKLGLFSIIGILSIFPTVYFVRNRKMKDGQEDDLLIVPKYIHWIIKLEVVLLIFIPLFAVLMATGYHV